MCVVASWLWVMDRTKNSRVNNLVREVAHARNRNETPYPICIKYGTVVGILVVIASANVGDDQLRDFGLEAVKFCPSP